MKYNKNKKYSPEELMEMAFQESLDSVHEHEDKPDPLVGAILTTSEGKILATAHRGELRIGEHCEYTLIERKLKSKNLGGCHLYVTLEPCIDKVRTEPKRGCATHILKARLGKVYVGMRDPDIDIENQGVKFLIENKIEVIDFLAPIGDKIRKSLREFIAYKEEQKLIINKTKKKKPVPFLQQQLPNVKISSFSIDAVQQFLNYSNATFTYPSQQFEDWAINFGITAKNDNDVVPTKLGTLLFGENASDVFPNSIFKVELGYNDEKIEIRDFEGPVATQLPRVLDFVKSKGLQLTIDRSEGKRIENSSFPFEILREAIANAIIHRDYSIEGAVNYLYIDSEKIILRSPGLPLEPLTITDIRTMDLPSISRNPKIMYIYNRMELAEQRGIGLRNMKKLPDFGFPLPTFNMKGNILEIVFARDANLIPEMKGFENLDLSDEDRKGIYFIQTNEPITVSDYANEFGLTNKTAQRRLADLIETGLLVKEGDKRWTKYLLKK